jgi:hypothetical protein
MSSSQQKKERREARHQRNIKKELDHKKEAWAEGKLIEENHNNGPYSKKYTEELCDRLCERLIAAHDLAINCKSNNEFLIRASGSRSSMFINFFRRYKNKIKDLILHWSPESPKSMKYNYLKLLIETYWDMPDNLLNIQYGK